ncbi:TIGR04290 family methyltransferase [Acidipila sp. EB88]|uniref:TIGR04290 family methyltransferase n=1 Tax=Acidipila sp. EB88 TaxID=2305226 RepID=UPI000F5D4E4C|nr:TIGR04290 family methyltransferase [Acidipila sp. EB88]RRA49392.1 TIGR04290 family methyltransferase [Acidipila sp. EB88]
MPEQTQAAATPQQQLHRAQIEALAPWFHNMWLDGIRTAPEHFLGDYPHVKYIRFRDTLPADMRGKTVLDIGCNAGFYSMEMKRRGADRVLGIDTDNRYLAQARLAAGINGLDIEFRRMSIWDVGSLGERFDLVIFMGVLYHLRHPLLALDLLHEHVCRDMFLFQSLQRGQEVIEKVEPDYGFDETAVFDRPGYPKMHFIEDRYCGDPTNWWLPNRACTEAMLRSAGFNILAHPEEEVYLCERAQLSPGSEHSVYPSAGIRPGAR